MVDLMCHLSVSDRVKRIRYKYHVCVYFEIDLTSVVQLDQREIQILKDLLKRTSDIDLVGVQSVSS